MKLLPEIGFSKIFYQNYDKVDVSFLKIKELNEKNNFNPFIIKDLFIDFYDNRFIINDEINKIYKVTKSTRSTKGKEEDCYYLSYVIEVKFELECEYSEYLLELRKDRDILNEHYGHRSLNCSLCEWNYYLSERSMGYQIFKKSKDTFDLWSKSLWL